MPKHKEALRGMEKKESGHELRHIDEREQDKPEVQTLP